MRPTPLTNVSTPNSTPSSSSTRFSLLSSSAFLLLFLGLSSLVATPAYGAITTPLSRNGDYVERNGEGTFCYYPTALDPTQIDVACNGPSKGDYAQVMAAHLNLTTSINYFSASFQRLGGTNWPVASNSSSTPGSNSTTARKIYLCLSGRAGDYTYQTMCTTVGKDNSLGNGGPSPFCKIQGGQRRVTDGCYIPNQPVPSFTLGAIGETTTRRAAVVTVTRGEGASGTTGVVRSGDPVSSGRQNTGGNTGSGSSTKSALGLLNAFVILVVTMVVRL